MPIFMYFYHSAHWKHICTLCRTGSFQSVSHSVSLSVSQLASQPFSYQVSLSSRSSQSVSQAVSQLVSQSYWMKQTQLRAAMPLKNGQNSFATQFIIALYSFHHLSPTWDSHVFCCCSSTFLIHHVVHDVCLLQQKIYGQVGKLRANCTYFSPREDDLRMACFYLLSLLP